jgi:dolichyl-diphosphooligosaccharide--protein glycosyltransferase
MKVVFSVAVIALIAVPAGTYWIPNPLPCTSANTYFCDQSPADSAVSLANGATTYSRAPFNDWTQTLAWIRQNTPTDSVVISWWDYGYWTAVVGNRTSAADNSTINGTRIAQIGQMYMSNITQAVKTAHSIGGNRPTYILLFVTGSIVQISSGQQYYILQVPAGSGFTAGGGDESKKQWFIRIGGLNESVYLECVTTSPSCPNVDDFNLTPYAAKNTLFGQLMPFQYAGFLVTTTDSSGNTQVTISPSYAFGVNGVPPVEAYTYPGVPTFGTNSTGPLRLVYESPSMTAPSACAGNSNINCFNAVLVYQVTG